MNINIGDALTPFIIESVSPESMKDWAVFLADPNPIHLDPEVVKAKGLGDRVINQGPTNVAYIINMLHNSFPGGTIEELDSRFLDNVYGGDRIETFGNVTDVKQVDNNTRISCEIGLRVDGRGDVISGTATVVVSN
ncbi:MAG: MaoC family dehydratase [Spongiibacteraceae bacterium]